ncbi:unnamed protein product [Penicillium nalgiovense]|nr:unnamed protein product [Penicillium nalgiovense]
MQVPLEFGVIRCEMPIRPYLRTGHRIALSQGLFLLLPNTALPPRSVLLLLLHFLLLSNSRYRIIQFLRSKTHPPRPKVLTVAVYTLQMSSTAGIHVAIYNDGGVYKHWSLFVNGPTDAEQTVLHIMGSSTNYRFEMRASDARKSATLSELIYLCDVPIAKVTLNQRGSETGADPQ